MLLLVFIISSLLRENAAADVITPFLTEKHVLEGEDVTLICNYTGTVKSLQWYRQYPGSKPEHLILFIETRPESVPSLRLTAAADKAVKHMNLTISSTEVKDSAMYYCALRNAANKIIFGTGTRLITDTKVQKSPEYYKLDDSCLATDFTNHSYVKSSGAGPVRYSGKEHQNFYSSFILGGAQDCPETGDCKEGSSGQSSEIEKDEKINFLSLGLFWLRILFVKTVAFNLLMTFKAWMS